MKKARSHWLQSQKGSYGGEWTPQRLIKWLNAVPQDRILELLCEAGGESYGGADAFGDLMELEERGLEVERLRRCHRCQKWYFARFQHQKFCSAACQQEYFRNSDEFRQRGREYMRNYREIQKKHNVK
jgi:hypothetical protein